MSFLFDRFAASAGTRRQRQRALVLVFPRSNVIGGRRRRTLVPRLGGRSGALQRVLRRGTGYQVGDAAHHVGFCELAVLAQVETVVIVVAAAVVTATRVVVRSEISLTVLVTVVEKHCAIRYISSYSRNCFRLNLPISSCTIARKLTRLYSITLKQPGNILFIETYCLFTVVLE